AHRGVRARPPVRQSSGDPPFEGLRCARPVPNHVEFATLDSCRFGRAEPAVPSSSDLQSSDICRTYASGTDLVGRGVLALVANLPLIRGSLQTNLRCHTRGAEAQPNFNKETIRHCRFVPNP